MRVAVIDYGTGNLGSMLRALEELGAVGYLATSPDQLAGAGRLILPGVGNFSDCMAALEAGQWIDALHQAVEGGLPLLGVCVGMQLLASSGSEGAVVANMTPGLGFVPGQVHHLRAQGCTARLPHVGWNAIHPSNPVDPLFAGIPDGTNYYFVHSYAFAADAAPDVIATAEHGVPFAAAIRRGRVWGTQFHPEKSSRAGFRLLHNFLSDLQC